MVLKSLVIRENRGHVAVAEVRIAHRSLIAGSHRSGLIVETEAYHDAARGRYRGVESHFSGQGSIVQVCYLPSGQGDPVGPGGLETVDHLSHCDFATLCFRLVTDLVSLVRLVLSHRCLPFAY